MNAHIITIGDEILIGQTLNTNAAYIGEKLTQNQINITGSSVVPDIKENIVAEFERSLANNDLVIVTGGLGPTHDDVTRNCIVDFFKSGLVKNEQVLSDIKYLFEIRGRILTKINEDQALIPRIALPIRNSKGTAPGFWIEKEDKIFIAMPGVPYEMKEMMNDFVIPRLLERNKTLGKKVIIKNLLTTGIPESTLFDKLGDLEKLLKGARLAFLPSHYGVKLRLTVEGVDFESAQNKLEEIEQKIRFTIGRYIFGKDEDTIEEVLANLLIDRGLKISIGESCTGGLISHRLTNISGSSIFFERGIVAYSNHAKVELLKVDEEIIAKYGAVSFEVAKQMANGAKEVSGADIGLAVTGILGPTGATPTKPIGLVYISLCDNKRSTVKEFRFGDNRLLNKDRTSQAAFEMLRRYLLGISYDD